MMNIQSYEDRNVACGYSEFLKFIVKLSVSRSNLSLENKKTQVVWPWYGLTANPKCP